MTPTHCEQQSFEFQELGSRKVIANFEGGHLSSDTGGALLLREIEQRTGLMARLARCFDDYRDPKRIEHSVPQLLSQRINGLVMGYEDLNDHDHLRLDPAHALAAGKHDILGAHRLEDRDRGNALAGHATLNRLELSAQKTDARYCKIAARPEAIRKLLITEGVKAIPRKSREIIIDFDATDDPLHGKQEGRYFQGYYRQYCYLPLYAFCGNIPLWAELRHCKLDACEGTVPAMEEILEAIRARFGKKVRVILRGDGGFSRDAIMDWCENHGVYYCLGYAKNSRLLKKVASKIKEQQLDLFADRTSTHWMASNQLRLWFSAFGHLIMHTLRACVLKGTVLERATTGTIRLRLFKIGARIKVSVRRVVIEMCSAYPLKELFATVHRRLELITAESG